MSQPLRRTQAERTAATRARIVAALVESISEVGFQRTTTSEITRRAGVTWGAVQHHFGGKDGILAAALEESFARFAARLGDLPGPETPLAERVSVFVDRAWAHFGSPDYRSTFEILLDHSLDPESPAEPPWQGEMFRAWNRVWDEIFADAPLPPRRRAALQTFTISALTGMASLGMLGRAVAPLQDAELALLKQTLVRELASSS